MDTRPTVILVEDDPDSFQMLTALLEDGGYNVVGGAEGYTIPGLFNDDPLPDPRPSLVVLDDRLPGVRGLTLCSILKDHPLYQDVPVMLITAHARDEEDEVEGLQAGSLEYLRKPFDTRVFMAKVDNLAATGTKVRLLRESESETLSLWESHPDTIFTLNATGHVTEVTPNLRENLGLTLGEVIDRKFTDLFLASDSGPLQPALECAMAARGGHATATLVPTTPGATPREVAITLIPVADARPPHVFAVVRDVTIEAQQQNVRHQAEKLAAVGLLSRGIAHSYNHLLAGILDHARAIATETERHGGPSPIADSVRWILDDATRGRNLANHLLRSTKPRLGQVNGIDLNESAGEVVAFLTPIYDYRNEIRLERWPSPLLVDIDGGAVHDALLNLCVNALEAGTEGAPVQVRTAPRTFTAAECAALGKGSPGLYHTVEVSHHGVGLDERVDAHLFVPFSANKAPAFGTGISLASAHAAVTAANGLLIVRSQPGEGTTVTIALPAAV